MFLHFFKININMRCIEIIDTVTNDDDTTSININMRCIEIVDVTTNTSKADWININMRCIEISFCKL